MGSSKTSLKKTGSIKRSKLKRVGHIATLWQQFRAKEARRVEDEEGLIKCQDHKMGLPRCGIARQSSDMDLHHIKGRNEAPSLYFDRSNLVWLTRECHNEAHNNG
jgi:hypothetical protein